MIRGDLPLLYLAYHRVVLLCQQINDINVEEIQVTSDSFAVTIKASDGLRSDPHHGFSLPIASFGGDPMPPTVILLFPYRSIFRAADEPLLCLEVTTINKQ